MPKKDPVPCSAHDGACKRPTVAKGLCHLHYQRLLNNGDVGPLDNIRGTDEYGEYKPRECSASVAACDTSEDGKCHRIADTRGLCSYHYLIFRRYRDPEYKVRKRDNERGWTEQYGYVVVRRPGSRKKIRLHRLRGEEFLGRELTPEENVHHRNGVRDDNSIGPCFMKSECACPGDVKHNLEFWAEPQPPGQRVSDLLKYAGDIIIKYGTKESIDELLLALKTKSNW